MNVVDRVRRLITQGVYSVATPFHPFGGAVDIIVVKQQDGTYRSTPWYVRFGKFQGVLKSAEKIVRISVNGVEANFHMYLDNSGEAYFLREVVPGSDDLEPNAQDSKDFGSFRTSKGNNLDNIEEEYQTKTICDESKAEVDYSRTSSDSHEQSPLNSLGSPWNSNYHYENVDEVNGLVKSTENSNSKVVLMCIDGHVITAPISKEEETLENLHSNIPRFHLGPAEAYDEDFDRTDDVWTAGLFSDIDSSPEKDAGSSEHQHEHIADAKGIPVSEPEANNVKYVDIERSLGVKSTRISKDQDLFKSCLDLTSHIEGNDTQDGCSSALELDKKEDSKDTFPSIDITLEKTTVNDGQNPRHCVSMLLPSSNVGCSADMQAVDIEIRDLGIEIRDLDTEIRDLESNIGDTSKQKDVQRTDHAWVSSDLHYADGSVAMNTSKNSEKKSLDTENTVNEDSGVTSAPSLSDSMEQKDALVGSSLGQEMLATEEERNKPASSGSRKISGYGFEISLCSNLLQPGMGRFAAKEAFEAHQISEDEFKVSGPEIIKNGNLIVRCGEEYYPWDKVAHVIVGITLFGLECSVDPTDSIPVEHVEVTEDREESNGTSLSTPSRRWRLWPIPFRRVKSLHRSTSDCSDDEVFLDSQSTFEEPSGSSNNYSSPRKNLLRTNIPTREQIASLNLKDGQNTIAFSFSTKVLGKQQVDAHIYLWKWNTRIVISDVDGTITRSDVLGQVMPLVGRDWTQSGVASLFSAIRENGYQLLFLSARAIVQAYLTKSFLSNLKQDGKALPSGPVVISPDGLFPSLYREVIRRAPHEFKIACLEDIRALFPSDYNPFYAGFGNRDTDELTYSKIGIPKGKIFIINPKGEVALYNRTDVKSYTSLHTMVHDMFPPTSLAEQEEYNSWNYWKVPLPSIED